MADIEKFVIGDGSSLSPCLGLVPFFLDIDTDTGSWAVSMVRGSCIGIGVEAFEIK